MADTANRKADLTGADNAVPSPDGKPALSRRAFLKSAGATIGAILSLSACEVIREEEEATRQVDLPLSNVAQYPEVPGTEDMPPPGVFGFFTVHEARAVEALTHTILPGSPGDPGAREAGVVFYIDALLWFDRGFGTRTYYRPPFAVAYEGETPPSDLNFGDVKVLWVPKELFSRYGWQSILTPREIYRMGIMAVDNYANQNFGSPYVDLEEAQQEQVMSDLAGSQLDPIGGQPSVDFFNILRDHTIEGMFSDPAYRGNRDMVGWRLLGYPGAQRAYTPLDIQDEDYFGKREPQSLAMLHPFNPGEISHPNAILPVSGSGTPGPEGPGSYGE